MDLCFLSDHICNRIERIRNDDAAIGEGDGYDALPGVRIFARNVPTLIQDGPQCGLIAIQMAASVLEQKVIETQNLYETAKHFGMTINGEIFSAYWLAKLMENVYPNLRGVEIEFPSQEKLTELLLTDHIIIVPYDCDRNHEPCLRNGHKAHWAILDGFFYTTYNCLEIEPAKLPLADNVTSRSIHVFAHHGKSKFKAMWDYDSLKESNAQLNESGPDRPEGKYMIPKAGMDLKGKCIIVHIQKPFTE